MEATYDPLIVELVQQRRDRQPQLRNARRTFGIKLLLLHSQQYCDHLLCRPMY
jgi:hypothetical protein